MPATLQLFERAGIAQPFLQHAHRLRGVRFVTPHGATYVSFSALNTPYPFVSILPQCRTEALLRERLNRVGGRILYGCSLESIELQCGVRARVLTPRGYETIRARYVAGCDGVRSTVRAQAGIAFLGRSYRESTLLTEVAVETAIPPDEARIHIDRTGVVTLFPMGNDLRRIAIVAPHEPLPPTVSRAWLQARIERAGMLQTRVGEPVWSSAFKVHRRVAHRMHAGPAFLVGDAAHAHSPVGGQGLRAGLFDAWTLAEVLAPVLAGDAPESALEAYERRRLPAARAVVRRTDFLTQALANPHPVMRVGRELVAPYVVRIPALRNRVVRTLLTA